MPRRVQKCKKWPNHAEIVRNWGFFDPYLSKKGFFGPNSYRNRGFLGVKPYQNRIPPLGRVGFLKNPFFNQKNPFFKKFLLKFEGKKMTKSYSNHAQIVQSWGFFDLFSNLKNKKWPNRPKLGFFGGEIGVFSTFFDF